jgi:hypothetical protein
MSKAAGQPLPNALKQIVDLLVESRIRIDAMEQILVKTNSVAYELYLGTIDNLRAPKNSGSEPSACPNAQIKAEETVAVFDHCHLVYLRPLCREIRMSRNEEVSQATSGDDSVTWIGRVK